MSSKKAPREKNQHIQVFVRCRPPNTQEKKTTYTQVVEVLPEKEIHVRDRPSYERATVKTFAFDKVFGPETKQVEVYKSVVGPMIHEVLMGYNCTVFAYGQTGTGKTFTMEGERSSGSVSWEHDPLAGIIPRSLHNLFDELKKLNAEYTVRVSFLELYNEELFDLLGSTDDTTRLRIFEDCARKGSVVIQNLEEVTVHNRDEVYCILEKGAAKRQTAATLMNASSSRSHTIFSITVHIKENTVEGDELLKTGKLNLVDLAGSENIGKSGSVDKRAREAGNINQSLLTLGRVITALVEKTPHVPYRESKLTRLLQDSLGGKTKTSIIATVSPALVNLEETLSTLDYAHRAKNIMNRPEINQKMNKRELIKEYTEEIERLRRDLFSTREKNGIFMSQENYHYMQGKLNTQSDEIRDKIAEIENLSEQLQKLQQVLRETKMTLEVKSKDLETALSNLKDIRNEARQLKQDLEKTIVKWNEQRHLVQAHSKTEEVLSGMASELVTVAENTTSDIEALQTKLSKKEELEINNKGLQKTLQNEVAKELTKMEDGSKVQINNLQKSLSSLNSHLDASTSYTRTHDKLIEDLLLEIRKSQHCGLQDLQKQAMESLKRLESHLQASTKKARTKKLKIDEIIKAHELNMSRIMNKMIEDFDAVAEKVQHASERMQQKIGELDCHYKASIQKQSAAVTKSKVQTDEAAEKFQFRVTELGRTSESLHKHNNADDANVHSFTEGISALIHKFLAHRKSFENMRDDDLKKFDTGLGEAENTARDIKSKNKSCEEASAKEAEEDLKQVTRLTEQVYQCQSSLVSEVTSLASDSKKEVQSLSAVLTEENQEIVKVTDEQLKLFEKDISDSLEHYTGDLHKISSSSELQLQNTDKIVSDKKCEVSKYLNQMEHLVNCSKENISEAEKSAHSVAECVSQASTSLTSSTSRFLDDIAEYIPTGNTPQRKEYAFPRNIVRTSPHERILGRLRGTVNPLVLEESVSEMDSSITESLNSENLSHVENLSTISISPVKEVTDVRPSLKDSEEFSQKENLPLNENARNKTSTAPVTVQKQTNRKNNGKQSNNVRI